MPEENKEQSNQSNVTVTESKLTVTDNGSYFVIENVLDEIEATTIKSIRYADESTAYLMAINTKNIQNDYMECILAKCNTSTKDISVLHRGFYSTEGTDNMSVQRIDENTDVIFTGVSIFYINDEAVEQILLDEGYKECANYNAKTTQIAYTEPHYEVLRLFNTTNDTNTVIAKQIKDENGEPVSMPCFPRINSDGTRILFCYIDPHGGMQKIVLADAEGKVLFEDLSNKGSMNTSYFWTNDGFVICCSTNDGKSKSFKLYDLNGNSTGDYTFDFQISDVYQDINENHKLQAFNAIADNGNWSLVLTDFNNGTAIDLYNGETAIISNDISQNGEKIIGVTNRGTPDGNMQCIFEAKISEIKSTTVEQ